MTSEQANIDIYMPLVQHSFLYAHCFKHLVFKTILRLLIWCEWAGMRAGVNNWFPDCKSDTFWDIVMKLHTITPNESRMYPIDFEVQRSRSWGMVNCKWFPDHNGLCNPSMIMKLHTNAPHESRMCPIDFEVKRSKVKVMGHLWLKKVSGP